MDHVDQVIAHLSPYIESTPGRLDMEALDGARAELFGALPETLQGVLRTWNGAYFSGELSFPTGVETRREGTAAIGQDSLVELWGLYPKEADGGSEETPLDLVTEAARHEEQAFLPRGLVAIGLGMENSLVLVSVRPQDLGAVFYWDWYWQYPWRVDFFQERIDRAMSAFADPAAAIDDLRHPDHDAVVEAAERGDGGAPARRFRRLGAVPAAGRRRARMRTG